MEVGEMDMAGHEVSAERDGKRRRRRGRLSLIAIGAVLTMLLSLMTPVGAAQERTTVSGDAVPSTCNNGVGAGAIALTGDLEGCLIFFPGSFECTELNGFALYEERGREVFVGKYDGQRGRFRTKYTLAATYTAGSCAEFDTGGFPFLNQLTGGCDHHIVGKRGVFKGMRGLLTFHDVIPEPGVSGASNFLYSGYLS
ncbi:MAG: hypothetical protein ACR2P0_10245 [Acidimicrobiales bacterium]